jgi:hypothetical protein
MSKIDINQHIKYNETDHQFPYSIIGDFAIDNEILHDALQKDGIYEGINMITDSDEVCSYWYFATHMMALEFARKFNTWQEH